MQTSSFVLNSKVVYVEGLQQRYSVIRQLTLMAIITKQIEASLLRTCRDREELRSEMDQCLFLMASGANKAEAELMGSFIWDRLGGLEKKGTEEAAP